MSDHASHGSGHISPVSLYITIFLALMVLTGVTVAAACTSGRTPSGGCAYPVSRSQSTCATRAMPVASW